MQLVQSAAVWAILLSPIVAAQPPEMRSQYSARDSQPDTDPNSPFWRSAPPIIARNDTFGHEVPHHQTEIRSRWTRGNLYLLYVCPYEKLHLKPNPDTLHETNELWHWDVAEVFVGSDLRNIRRYKEFEVSPQAEWIDLDIDLAKLHHEDGWTWNSGFQVQARIDSAAQVWYAFMRIPYSAIDVRPAHAGNVLRANFYRAQGPPSEHKAIAWQPTGKATYHVPETFGLLRLVE